MENLLAQLFEKAKTNKKAFLKLKSMAVDLQSYELASKIREIEKELFPENEEEKKAKKESKDLKLMFSMVELNISEETCWLINEALTVYKEKKGNFDLMDSSKLLAKTKQLFNS